MSDASGLIDCDVLVAGSGAAGLASAVTAAHHGMSVMLAERENVLGGTTARTAGSMWIPCNRIAAERGIEDGPEKVRTYLKAVVKDRFDELRVNSFIENAPRALDFFLERTALRVFCPVTGSDYHPELPGGLEVGRSLYTEPYDGRLLGDYFSRLAAPPPVHTFAGLVPQLGRDVLHFLRANKSLRSALHVAKRMAIHAYEVSVHGRPVRLTNGTALAARLMKSALEAGVQMRTSSPVVKLIQEHGRISGALLDTPSGEITVRTRRGVVLACGGASHDPAFRKTYFPPALNAHPYWPATALGSAGDGIRVARSVGAQINDNMATPAAWSPMSLVPTARGYEVLPLFGGRAFPGVIAVTRRGKRFVNEANAYHDFGTALIEATAGDDEACAFVICDAAALHRYGLGYVRPFPFPHGRHRRSGYLMCGATVAKLARIAGIEPDALETTVAEVNRDARQGVDSEFGKGDLPYNRRMGDDLHQPSPCIAPLEKPPFYAIKIVVGDIGTYAGLATDDRACVLDTNGLPIAGLYAAGNDMASIFGGADPAGGTMLGPAITFGYVAGRNIAGIQ